MPSPFSSSSPPESTTCPYPDLIVPDQAPRSDPNRTWLVSSLPPATVKRPSGASEVPLLQGDLKVPISTPPPLLAVTVAVAVPLETIISAALEALFATPTTKRRAATVPPLTTNRLPSPASLPRAIA